MGWGLPARNHPSPLLSRYLMTLCPPLLPETALETRHCIALVLLTLPVLAWRSTSVSRTNHLLLPGSIQLLRPLID